MKKVYFFIILAVVLSIFIVSGLVTAEPKENKELKRAIFSVENITCSGCFSTINEALTPAKGFSGFGTNLLRRLVAVDFLPPLTAAAIAGTVTDLGYPATIESVQDITEKKSFAVVHTKQNLYSGCSGGGQSSCGNTDKRSPYNSGAGSCCDTAPVN